MGSGRIKSVKARAKGVARPVPPPYLDEAARHEYEALVDALDKSGSLPQTDPKLIEAYACNYTLLVRAVGELSKSPLTYTNEQGRPFVNPLIAVVHNATQKVRQVIADLGLSPVSAKLVGDRLPTIEQGGKWEGLLD